jgi:hypothetical protein
VPCESGYVDNRLIDANPGVFGDSGFRLDEGIVFYDHATESLWYQLSGTAFRGEWTGVRLVRIAAQTIYWRDWVVDDPDSLVLNVSARG